MYDAAGRCVQLAENGSTPSYSGNAIKNFLWCGAERCEERDNSNAVVSVFRGLGQKTSGSNEFYSFDHLGSIREVTNGSSTVQGAFDFDPYGNMSVLSGSLKPDFGFTGIYQHSRTNLALTWFRQYSPGFGRWLSRDLIGRQNLYSYGLNAPVKFIDSLGLSPNYPKISPTQFESIRNASNSYHLLLQFLTGNGPSIQTHYDSNDKALQEIINSPGAQAIRDQYLLEGTPEYTDDLSFDTVPAAFATVPFDPLFLKTPTQVGGFDKALAFRSDQCGNPDPQGSYVTFVITNIAGRKSFLLHLFPDKPLGESGSMKSIIQTFRWTEKIIQFGNH